MDFYTAKTQFNNYLKDYDCHNDKIRLKIVHTYGVVKESADIAARMKLSEEDTSLAKMIALLHDIGRFEQLKQFDSFLPDTMDLTDPGPGPEGPLRHRRRHHADRGGLCGRRRGEYPAAPGPGCRL